MLKMIGRCWGPCSSHVLKRYDTKVHREVKDIEKDKKKSRKKKKQEGLANCAFAAVKLSANLLP